jgi:hypothetical protein
LKKSFSAIVKISPVTAIASMQHFALCGKYVNAGYKVSRRQNLERKGLILKIL